MELRGLGLGFRVHEWSLGFRAQGIQARVTKKSLSASFED